MKPTKGNARQADDQNSHVIVFTLSVEIEGERSCVMSNESGPDEGAGATHWRKWSRAGGVIVGIATVTGTALGVAQWLGWP
ncbi:hypothetical protein SAMN04489712_12813 [Thermomonospora echinospora]|uniref:Uncharacterized protein n=1 Tax=Thermomonospora echinospora TaxID=1992 RepID=A0A1H6E078_9ACTN|nr:hypothetical protein [Thermomonospora echinospora]SEG91008.1 hypothetical protein SAMN04489712_12813 [Thermomonospora echinospora]